MHKKTSLKELISSNEVLSINPQNILCFARIKNIWQLLSLAQWNEIEWIAKNKVLNKDTIILAKYILEKTVEILWYDPIEIKDKPLLPIAMRIWEELIKTDTIENFVIGTYIEKIAHQVNSIHLRYERLNKHKQNLELKKDSTRDHLTWLFNRRSMELYLDDAIANKRRNWENYWVIMIDIDFFKIINDTYWHNTWDIVLEEISILFREFFREEDKICRWWWEEFLILMKWWNKQAYLKKLEKLRKEIEKTLVWLVNKKIKSYWCKCKDWEEDHDCHCEDEITQENITVSIWLSSLDFIDDKTTIVKRADDWLYLAKASWRNKVTFKEIIVHDII